MVGAGVVVLRDARAHVADVAPADEGVDQAVASLVFEALGPEAQAQQVVREVRKREVVREAGARRRSGVADRRSGTTICSTARSTSGPSSSRACRAFLGRNEVACPRGHNDAEDVQQHRGPATCALGFATASDASSRAGIPSHRRNGYRNEARSKRRAVKRVALSSWTKPRRRRPQKPRWITAEFVGIQLRTVGPGFVEKQHRRHARPPIVRCKSRGRDGRESQAGL
jgi:hypothetical protein